MRRCHNTRKQSLRKDIFLNWVINADEDFEQQYIDIVAGKQAFIRLFLLAGKRKMENSTVFGQKRCLVLDDSHLERSFEGWGF